MKKLVCILIVIISVISVLPSTIFADDIEINSPVALLMEMSTGKIVYEKDIYEKVYPASLTKVLTAIIVLENCSLEETATCSYDAIMGVEYGYVVGNLQIGEELTVEQLLNVLMVASANDAAVVLAEHVAGTVEEFAVLMNEKAKEIGCLNSNFVNPNGIHDENHYTTAYDLALIARYAMQNETFREIVSKTYYILPATNKYDRDDRVFGTTNELLLSNSNERKDNYYYRYATGIKTGFTTPAGYCLIASSEKNGLEYIAVILKAGQTNDGTSGRYVDARTLFEYGYDNFLIKKVAQKGNSIQTIEVKNATRDTKKLDVLIDDDVYAFVKKEDINSPVDLKINIDENLKAPIKQGEIVGTVTYDINDIKYERNLIAANEVKKSNIFIKFVLLFILIFIIFMVVLIKNMRAKNRRLKMMRKIK